MASDLGVGDSDVPFLVVQPADTDTVATLTARRPDGTSVAVPVTGGPLVAVPDTSPVEYTQRWDATNPLEYDLATRWVLHWDVQGTGEGEEDFEVWVVPSPAVGGPTWTPSRSKTATYVPHRTLARSVASTTASQDQHQFTFDNSTTPSGTQADALIVDAVAWVSARVPKLTAAHHDLARAAAALLAAAWIERSWPNDDQSLQRANDMEKRVDVMLGDLAQASADANAEDGSSYPTPAAPYWSFPSPDPRFDDARYW